MVTPRSTATSGGCRRRSPTSALSGVLCVRLARARGRGDHRDQPELRRGGGRGGDARSGHPARGRDRRHARGVRRRVRERRQRHRAHVGRRARRSNRSHGLWADARVHAAAQRGDHGHGRFREPGSRALQRPRDPVRRDAGRHRARVGRCGRPDPRALADGPSAHADGRRGADRRAPDRRGHLLRLRASQRRYGVLLGLQLPRLAGRRDHHAAHTARAGHHARGGALLVRLREHRRGVRHRPQRRPFTGLLLGDAQRPRSPARQRRAWVHPCANAAQPRRGRHP